MFLFPKYKRMLAKTVKKVYEAGIVTPNTFNHFRDISYANLYRYIEKKTIFIHIPKAAGISINTSVYNSWGMGHFSIDDCIEMFGNSTYRSFFKFAFVRNPWDRLLSAYFFLKKGGINHKDHVVSKLYSSNFQSFKNFINWVSKGNNRYKIIHTIPQYDFLVNSNSDTIDLDFLGRFENITHDFKKICTHIGITNKLPHLNSGKKRDYKSYYSIASKNIVNRIYEKDVDFFKYSF